MCLIYDKPIKSFEDHTVRFPVTALTIRETRGNLFHEEKGFVNHTLEAVSIYRCWWWHISALTLIAVSINRQFSFTPYSCQHFSFLTLHCCTKIASFLVLYLLLQFGPQVYGHPLCSLYALCNNTSDKIKNACHSGNLSSSNY